ncbi:hypothetical protein GLOTRDRAFT_96917 [Gloeophyllum trabeum ATCC 11539]|uniref:Uncharacterized protein n=1 Tax=Gloeophyllum trabeum (strain ATCC 11539 / FP-39264 / Madison 617) TaxID=670483 RepID=S7PTC8_GLOTA|nr:uncharacterized protein GLOTRDRAFT_96917 [Gloeophyllum trabeum ATCC 11539]EPQ50673.1 hypothetical protein GLOTRDRAFT_96917 [Gloeophyllum trabeum ATCC 11539]
MTKRVTRKKSRASGVSSPAKPTARRPAGRTRKTPKSRGAREASEEAEQGASSIFSGNMDLYSCELESLKEAYLPDGAETATVRYKEVYEKIWELQLRHEYSARIFLDGDQGRFRTDTIFDPISKDEYEISIIHIEMEDPLTFSEDERALLPAPELSPPRGAGMSGRTSTRFGYCGVSDAEGVFKMQRVWVGEGGEELFEGYFSLDVTYSYTWIMAGHGPEVAYKMPFWAVRARRDQLGEEIGLGPVFLESEEPNIGWKWSVDT